MSLLSRYKTWVRANSTTISAVEGGLSSLTWLLPDRFSDSELALEAFNSLLGFLSLYHESILSSPAAGQALPQLPWTFWLAALQQIEVLVEIGANSLERKQLTDKYTPLAVLEAAKAALRLITFCKAGGRILTDGGMTATLGVAVTPELKIQAVCAALARFHRRNCSDDGKHIQDELGASTSAQVISNKIFELSKLSPRCTTYGAMSGIDEGPSASGERSYWWEQPSLQKNNLGALSEEAYAHERMAQQRLLETQAQWRELAGRHLLVCGELSHILRPLLYVLALRRWGRRSWKPWILSLVVEAASAQLLSLATSYRAAGQRTLQSASSDSLGILQSLQTFKWSPVEQRELTRRRLLFLFYLLRSPFFDTFTRKGVTSVQAVLKPVPVVGMLSDKAAEILCGIQQYYTYTSAS